MNGETVKTEKFCKERLGRSHLLKSGEPNTISSQNHWPPHPPSDFKN